MLFQECDAEREMCGTVSLYMESHQEQFSYSKKKKRVLTASFQMYFKNCDLTPYEFFSLGLHQSSGLC